MRINHNMSAVITNDQLLNTENTLAKSMERLSSGLRINHAGDDPAGIAISAKMKAQIDGLDQASRNSNDGTSVIQTADGALNEVTSMLQRIRELAVQAANGTNSQSDRESIQLEIASLKEEIDRVSEATEFNGKTLLDGSQDARIYSSDDKVTRIQSSEAVAAGNYKFEVVAEGKQAVVSGGTIPSTMSNTGTVAINGYVAEIGAGMSDMSVYQALRNAAEKAQATISDPGEPLEFKTEKIGYKASLEISVNPPELAAALGLPDYTLEAGVDPVVDIEKETPDSQFGKQATVEFDGYRATFSDVDGFRMDMYFDSTFKTGPVTLDVTDIGIMRLQIGANEGQNMNVRIPSTDCDHLYIDDVDVTVVNGPEKAIVSMDYAISRLTDIRSQLGAYENRLEHTTASLNETGENMTAALSRIEDVDMATEMVEYTKDNVLAQAGTSALSQANELPQLALQLLNK